MTTISEWLTYIREI